MSRISISNHFDRTKLARIADWLAVAVAASLPWSTTATSILLVLWLLALIPTLDWVDVRHELLTPAGGLPVLLFMLGVVGMFWADVAMIERWKGLDSFFKLLVIPLLMIQFRRSSNWRRVFFAFFIACVVLLIASWLVTIWPEAPWKTSRDGGVAVKSYIVQSAEFTICAAALAWLSVEAAHMRRWLYSITLFILALAFLADIFFIATSRTTVVVVAVLLLLYGARQYRWKGFFAAAVAGVVLVAALWATSPYLRLRVTGIFTEAKIYEANNIRTPTGERIVFWTKSLRFIESAPLFGHGTGSITEMFRRSAVGEFGSRAEVSTNPHNQTFAVAIQLGLIGVAVLWAMWLSHMLLFRGGGLNEWLGLVLVVQHVVGALFNSYLFDFTEGWIYVFGVGVAAGVVRRRSQIADTGENGRVAASVPKL